MRNPTIVLTPTTNISGVEALCAFLVTSLKSHSHGGEAGSTAGKGGPWPARPPGRTPAITRLSSPPPVTRLTPGRALCPGHSPARGPTAAPLHRSLSLASKPLGKAAPGRLLSLLPPQRPAQGRGQQRPAPSLEPTAPPRDRSERRPSRRPQEPPDPAGQAPAGQAPARGGRGGQRSYLAHQPNGPRLCPLCVRTS